MSDIENDILAFVKSEKQLTKIIKVGESSYRVNVYTRTKKEDSVLTITNIDRSYYLGVDKNNTIHDLTRGKV